MQRLLKRNLLASGSLASSTLTFGSWPSTWCPSQGAIDLLGIVVNLMNKGNMMIIVITVNMVNIVTHPQAPLLHARLRPPHCQRQPAVPRPHCARAHPADVRRQEHDGCVRSQVGILHEIFVFYTSLHLRHGRYLTVAAVFRGRMSMKVGL